MWWCCFAISHSGTMGEIVPWREGFHSGQPSFRMTPCWQPHNWAPCFFAGCRTSMDCTGVRCWGRRMPQNRAPHSAQHSWLLQTCSTLGTPYTVWCATMETVCNCTGLVEPVAEGRWWLPWKDRHSGRNLGSLIRTTFEATIKWIEASWLPSSEESAPYTE